MTRQGLIACVVVGALAAVVVLAMRHGLEARYRSVEIALDAQDWVTLIRREGGDVAAVMRDLRGRGATSVALADVTLKQLAEEGAISYASGGTLASLGRVTALAEPFRGLQAAGRLRPDAVYITGPADRLAPVGHTLRALVGDARVRALDGALEVRGTQLDLEELGLGFRKADVVPFMAAGLEIVLRPRNYRGLTAGGLRTLANGYGDVSPFPTLIFALTEVQGYEGLVAEAAAEYRRIGALFGRIEVFTARRKQKGEDRLTDLMRPEVVRVFSVTPEELLVLPPEEIVDKFVRAAQERNLRVLYVRPLLSTPAGVSALDVNLNLVEAIAARLRGFGFTMGRAAPLPPLTSYLPLILIIAIGATALGLLVLEDLTRAVGVRIPAEAMLILLAVAAIGTAAAGLTRFDALWRQLLALATAVAGAAGATVWALPRAGGGAGGGAAVAGWTTLVRAIALAALAGMFVAALLSQWAFMLAFSTFLGVKVAHVVPIVLVGLWLAFAQRPSGGWRTAAREVAIWLGQPLRLGVAFAVLVIGLAAVMLLARTGNINLPLAGVEQLLRTTLEAILVARPRTKEFLIGYPALVIAGTAAALGWRRLAVPFALAGTIGTAGAINSFSHAHTPLLYTAWRTGNALLLGAILALPAVVVLLWIARRRPRS